MAHANLEDALRNVQSLRNDLRAVITLGMRKEEGYWEDCEVSEQVLDSRWTWGSTPITETHTEKGWVPPREVPINKPDIEKRESAQARLQQIYHSSIGSVKYVAGCALYVDDRKLLNQIDGWLDTLGDRIKLDSEREDVKVVYDIPYSTSTTESHPNTKGLVGFSISKIPSRLSDIRRKAGKLLDVSEADILGHELTKISLGLEEDELQKVYRHASHPEYRQKAGQWLGYPPVRIFCHEHPVAATVSGIASTGVASGLVYALVEYFNK
ncbi:MAG: hypothetical protein KKE23_01305 [Nanoarchaeota archaeon]|nr:hypothetical protein [Nanoarchaeota archaeon]